MNLFVFGMFEKAGAPEELPTDTRRENMQTPHREAQAPVSERVCKMSLMLIHSSSIIYKVHTVPITDKGLSFLAKCVCIILTDCYYGKETVANISCYLLSVKTAR